MSETGWNINSDSAHRQEGDVPRQFAGDDTLPPIHQESGPWRSAPSGRVDDRLLPRLAVPVHLGGEQAAVVLAQRRHEAVVVLQVALAGLTREHLAAAGPLGKREADVGAPGLFEVEAHQRQPGPGGNLQIQAVIEQHGIFAGVPQQLAWLFEPDFAALKPRHDDAGNPGRPPDRRDQHRARRDAAQVEVGGVLVGNGGLPQPLAGARGKRGQGSAAAFALAAQDQQFAAADQHFERLRFPEQALVAPHFPPALLRDEGAGPGDIRDLARGGLGTGGGQGTGPQGHTGNQGEGGKNAAHPPRLKAAPPRRQGPEREEGRGKDLGTGGRLSQGLNPCTLTVRT
ncbi:hypothetical protein DVJ83_05255 [Deinococcus wulumuqiensis]|uniref:Uncharacterized protein n=1 Tax=Deinococcus wulumuqiensis TaxID=980427 RepID=A0A345IG43_9DEIO|nr:hypothetical protein DVJ83_05255 [Deinococcus wulumuqiensis]